MVLIHNVYYDTGKSAAYYHAQIGSDYDLPCISMQNSIYPAVAAEDCGREDYGRFSPSQ